MFGILDDIADAAIDIVTKPIIDAVDVIDGLTEGELRERAALRLGADVAGGMALNELMEWYSED